MPDDVKVILNNGAIENLKDQPAMRELLEVATKPKISRAKSGAPKATGAGAASIHSDAVLSDGWSLEIGWDQDHYYMRFHELGTIKLSARPFLVPAFQ